MSGIEINQSTKSFKMNNKKYPKGTFIIYSSQAFRPHLIDMMEKQNYPQITDSSGKPKVPYDLAGWTLPLQMGISVDRVNDSFKVDTKTVSALSINMPNGKVSGSAKNGYLLTGKSNASFIAVNQLLSKGIDVFRTNDGSFFIKSNKQLNKSILNQMSEQYSINFEGSKNDLSKNSTKLCLKDEKSPE